MAQYTISIPDGQGAAVVEALCQTYGYSPTMIDPNTNSTLSPNEFARQQIIKWLYQVTANYQGAKAAATARTAAIEAVNTGIDIT